MKRPFSVVLAQGPNPNIRGGYWTAPADAGAPVGVPADRFDEASALCRGYIERNGLGAGNWRGGAVLIDGLPVARVSYNGRVWEAGGTGVTERAV